MRLSDALVSIGLPVFNGGTRLVDVVSSVLAQDHERVQLVISDNASTDETEHVCRELAAADDRIRYHRHPRNIGLLNNFQFVMRCANGTFFRWIGDDDTLAPDYVTRCLEIFAEKDRLLLVTTEIAYEDSTRTGQYLGTALASNDPVERFTEMLLLSNETRLVLDPLYGLMRRAEVATIPRRNVIQEDQVFAAKLALAGPWGHVPEVLATRGRRQSSLTQIARGLDLPVWHARVANTFQILELMRTVSSVELTTAQRRAAMAAIGRMYLRRQQRTAALHGRTLVELTTGRVR